MQKQPKPKAVERDRLTIVVKPPAIRTLTVKIIGVTSLICHRFSEESKQQIRIKQQGLAKESRQPKDPKELQQQCLYELPGKLEHYGFPSSGLKRALVDAAAFSGQGVFKTSLRGALFIIGDYIEIKDKWEGREDPVRIGRGITDLRYRAHFPVWEAEVKIRYNTNVISAEQVINLLHVAGFSIGIGDWRPQCNGSHGQFDVAVA